MKERMTLENQIDKFYFLSIYAMRRMQQLFIFWFHYRNSVIRKNLFTHKNDTLIFFPYHQNLFKNQSIFVSI